MLKMENVSFQIKNKQILTGISYTFPSQGVVILQGEIGTGKTTILNLIFGLYKPTEGSITLDTCIEGRKDMFYNTVSDNLLPNLTVKENLKLVFSRKQQDEIRRYFEEQNLMYLWNRTCNKLSSGEIQKVSLYMALVRKAKITLLDEPLCNLDKDSIQFYFNKILELGKESLVVMCMHENDLASFGYANVIKLESGKIKEVEEEQLNSSENLYDRKSAVCLKKSFLNMFPFFWKNPKSFFFIVLVFCFFLAFCIASAVDLKMTSDETLYNRGLTKFGPQMVETTPNQEQNNCIQKLNLSYSFLSSESEIHPFEMNSLFRTDTMWVQGKSMELKEDAIYISDYLYGILYSGEHLQNPSLYIPKDLSKDYLTKRLDMQFYPDASYYSPVRREEVSYVVYETDYREYLPSIHDADYSSRIFEFAKRVDSFYLNVYASSRMIASLFASEDTIYLTKGISIAKNIQYPNLVLKSNELNPSMNFLIDYFDLPQNYSGSFWELVQKLDGKEIEYCFKTLNKQYVTKVKIIAVYGMEGTTLVSDSLYQTLYQELNCDQGESFTSGIPVSWIDFSFVDFKDVEPSLKNPEIDFLQKNYVLNLIQTRENNQILFTSGIVICSIVLIVLIAGYILIQIKKEKDIYRRILFKGYDKKNMFVLCFLPQLILGIITISLALLSFYFTRGVIAQFFHLV